MDVFSSFREFFAFFVFLGVLRVSAESEGNPQVITVPSGRVTRRVGEDLNLTCKIASDKTFSIMWMMPQDQDLQVHRIKKEDRFNEQSVTIYQLEEPDTGMYTCVAQHHDTVFRKRVYVSVSMQLSPGRKLPCFEHSFVCGNGLCIPKRYTCDGRMDCPDGTDEAPDTCGTDPCEDKVLCDDGRCLPRSMCCDPATQLGCRLTYMLPCCRKYLASIANASVVSVLIPHQHFGGGSSASVEYLQSSVYTVVSCAVVFILVATVMVAAICRIHMRRSVMATSFPLARGAAPPRCLPWCRQLHPPGTTTTVSFPSIPQQPGSLAGFPTAQQGLSCPHLSAGGADLRTVTCAHGSYVVASYSTGSHDDGHAKVHFFQHLPPRPPKYSPIAEGPPPPYRSTDDLSTRDANKPGQRWPTPADELPTFEESSARGENDEAECLLPPYTEASPLPPTAAIEGERRAST
ncbi:unnamed protein product [Ixodes hexagonus]